MNIRSVKLLKNKFSVRWETNTPEGKTVKHEIPDGAEPDEQVQDTISDLKADVVSILEFTKGYAESYTVTGISVSEDEGRRKVVFTGKKELKGGRSIAINTPLMHEAPDGEEQKGSSFMSSELADRVQRVVDGARRYVENGARAQTDIEDES